MGIPSILRCSNYLPFETQVTDSSMRLAFPRCQHVLICKLNSSVSIFSFVRKIMSIAGTIFFELFCWRLTPLNVRHTRKPTHIQLSWLILGRKSTPEGWSSATTSLIDSPLMFGSIERSLMIKLRWKVVNVHNRLSAMVGRKTRRSSRLSLVAGCINVLTLLTSVATHTNRSTVPEKMSSLYFRFPIRPTTVQGWWVAQGGNALLFRSMTKSTVGL